MLQVYRVYSMGAADYSGEASEEGGCEGAGAESAVHHLQARGDGGLLPSQGGHTGAPGPGRRAGARPEREDIVVIQSDDTFYFGWLIVFCQNIHLNIIDF